MTLEELNKIRIEPPFPIEECSEADDYGHYSTGGFNYRGMIILITKDDGKWHMSVSASRPIGYYELKQLRYEFLPDNIHAAQIFPPRAEFVNLHKNCYHLYEV